MDSLSANYNLKVGSVKELDLYLRARTSKHVIPGLGYPTKTGWEMRSDDYVKSAIVNLETELNKIDFKLPKSAETPLSVGCRLELDSSK